MRLIKSFSAAVMLVVIMAGTCWAAGADLVAEGTRLREKDPVEAIRVLDRAISSGELTQTQRVAAHRSRATAYLMVFKAALEIGTRDVSDSDRRLIARGAAVALHKAREDANRTLDLAPGDSEATMVLRVVSKITEMIDRS